MQSPDRHQFGTGSATPSPHHHEPTRLYLDARASLQADFEADAKRLASRQTEERAALERTYSEKFQELRAAWTSRK
jgi:hypothetical protein